MMTICRDTSCCAPFNVSVTVYSQSQHHLCNVHNVYDLRTTHTEYCTEYTLDIHIYTAYIDTHSHIMNHICIGHRGTRVRVACPGTPGDTDCSNGR